MLLEELPTDLLVEIVDWVGTDTYMPQYGFVIGRGTRYLYQLALCSRKLNTLTTAVLYKTYTQTGDKALPKFLLRVLRNPGLRKHVRSFVSLSVRTFLPIPYLPPDHHHLNGLNNANSLVM
jgi:hypothetical protein